MRHAALFVVMAGLAVGFAVWLRLSDGTPPSAEPPLELAAGGAQLRLNQRRDAVVPGSGGRLYVHIGDITRGQVELTLTHRDGRVIIPVTSMVEGDRRGFALGVHRYRVTLVSLHNRLIGDDTAVLEFDEGPSQIERIEALLAVMEDSDLTFLRNDQEYDGAEAAAHLRRKWKSIAAHVRTAEQFIEEVATKSLMTGRLYRVRLADGTVLEAHVWLTSQLARY